jgi:hypothetical protein
MTCPECGSSEIRRSRSGKLKDVFQRVRGREPFRCSKCRVRFFAMVSPELAFKETAHSQPGRRSLWNSRIKKRLAKRMIVISIFAAALVIFLIFLRYVTTEQNPSSDSGNVTVREVWAAG